MTKDLLEMRGTTHGDFKKNATISQQLKRLFRVEHEGLSLVQLEALDMIALKLSRILSGHSDFDDHWRDIAGYATLVVNELNRLDDQVQHIE